MEHEHPIHFGRGSMKRGSDLLVDPEADFTKLPLKEMLNLHVHWGTPEAGVNDMRFDNDEEIRILTSMTSWKWSTHT